MNPNILAYHHNSLFPRFDVVSKNIADRTGGFGLKGNGTSYAKYFVQPIENENDGFFIINKKQFRDVKSYLKAHQFRFEEIEEEISLCCEKSTEMMKAIKVNFQMENGPSFKNFFIYSPQKLSTLNVRAYFDKFGRQEELLQKELVQFDIDIRSDPAFFDLIHCSSSFRIFDSPEKANETIDKEMFDYMKESASKNHFNPEEPYEGAFISGHEHKYRWPLSLPSKGLSDGKGKHGNLVQICMVGGPPAILATHRDGTTIVTNDTTDELPLKQYFNPLEGVCFDLGMRNGGNIHDYYLGVCRNCEEEKVEGFRKKIINKIGSYKKGGQGFDLTHEVAKKMNYKINYDDLKVNVVEKERRFK